jgi:hypothetical protein
MANSNNICTRFINYAAVLILVFLSSSVFAAGGSFSGGGASGSWDGPTGCKAIGYPQAPQFTHLISQRFSNPLSACQAIQAAAKQHYGTNPPWTFDISSNDFTGAGPTYSCDVGNVLGRTAVDCNELKCPDGYEKDANGKCQPKKCPVGQTLVNGQCKPKQCPAGQALDLNGNCMPPDDQCPAGQTMVNGRCTDKPDDPEPDPNSEWPPFCEWASVMCQWHQEWQQWSNDYAANEQKANLDREELKRLALDSKEYLSDLNNKTDTTNQKLQDLNTKTDTTIQKLEDLKIPLNQIKDQDSQFYDELRLWLENFDPADGTPSDQNPSISFPPFCDWSVQVCNWYLDWKDWRADYNAHNAAVLEKFNQNLERLNEIKQQDKEFYDDSRQFQNDVRDFFDWYKDQEDNPDPNDPNNPENEDGGVSVDQQQIPLDESQRITFVNGCPAGQQFNVSFMGQSSNLEFSYQPICQFMSMIRPFVIAIAYLIGAYILMGLSRGSSE